MVGLHLHSSDKTKQSGLNSSERFWHRARARDIAFVAIVRLIEAPLNRWIMNIFLSDCKKEKRCTKICHNFVADRLKYVQWHLQLGFLRFFQRFGRRLSVFYLTQAPTARAKSLGYFARKQYTVIIFQGATAPSAPPLGAYICSPVILEGRWNFWFPTLV